MRALACALALSAGACTAIDSFSYSFGSDLGSVPLAGFGEPCNANRPCDPGTHGRPLSCLDSLGAATFTDGMCTRSCIFGAAVSCSDYPMAGCPIVQDAMAVCLPRCGNGCRVGYDCCMGFCAPPNSNLCGH